MTNLNPGTKSKTIAIDDQGREHFQYDAVHTAQAPAPGTDPNAPDAYKAGLLTAVDDDVAPLGTVFNMAHYVLNSIAPVPKGLNDCFLYEVQLQLEGTRFGTVIFLVHREQFTHEQLEEHVKRASQRVVETAIKIRRQGVRCDPKLDFDQINHDYFIADARFFSAAMCDMFDYRLANTTPAAGQLPRTAVRADSPPPPLKLAPAA